MSFFRSPALESFLINKFAQPQYNLTLEEVVVHVDTIFEKIQELMRSDPSLTQCKAWILYEQNCLVTEGDWSGYLV